MKLETLMIKAIREFKKANPKAEIRSCYMASGFGTVIYDENNGTVVWRF